MTEDTPEERTHGQTYGEAVDEALEECAKNVADLSETAQEHREAGDEGLALAYEGLAGAHARKGLELAQKRDRMPFGIESARGFGETMENPTLTFLEYLQRVQDDE